MASKCPDCFKGFVIMTTAYNCWEEICSTCDGTAIVSRTVCKRCQGFGNIPSYKEIYQYFDGNGQIQAETEIRHSVECPDCKATGYLN